MKYLPRILLLSTSLSFMAHRALAAELPMTLVIESHHFVPAELVVPAGQKIRLTVVNRDATVEEFESYTLNREKVVAGKSSIVVWIGPLSPGRYAFFGDYNQKTAQGVIVAR